MKESLLKEYPKDQFDITCLDGELTNQDYYIVSAIQPGFKKKVIVVEKLIIGIDLSQSPDMTAGEFCGICGCNHPEGQPHNSESLFYKYRFYKDNGRMPTWEDAMAHCSSKVKAFWTTMLELNDIPIREAGK